MSLFANQRDELNTHLTLLWRNYEATIRHYDKPSLIALAHTLRYWADASHGLKEVDPDFAAKVFYSVTPGKRIKKLLSGRAHFAVYFHPDGVSTFVGNNNLLRSFDPSFNGDGQPCIIFQPRKSTNPNERCIDHLIYVDRPKNCNMLEQLGDEAHRTEEKKLDFSSWLNAESIRFTRITNEAPPILIQISHETIIREVANNYGSSHPTIRNNSKLPPQDPNIEYLMNHWLMNDIPLPYYILLKIAKAILMNFAPVLSKPA